MQIGLNSKMARTARRRRLAILRLRSIMVGSTAEAVEKLWLNENPFKKITTEVRNYAAGAGESGIKNVAGLSYGHVSMMGRRRVMEDTVTVPPVEGWPDLAGDYIFFGVYDGHGGAEVAEMCRENMHRYLGVNIEKSPAVDIDWEKVMSRTFSSMEREIEGRIKVTTATVGSTALVVLVGEKEIAVAYCGDSRAVLCRGLATVALSRDHRPDRPDEKERIEAAGGVIIDRNGLRVEGGLTTSRSLGSEYLKPYVTSDPEVTVVERSPADEFLIIATDGLFDAVSNETACDVVRRYWTGKIPAQGCEESPAYTAAMTLAELAIAKGSRDNISIIVVYFK